MQQQRVQNAQGYLQSPQPQSQFGYLAGNAAPSQTAMLSAFAGSPAAAYYQPQAAQYAQTGLGLYGENIQNASLQNQINQQLNPWLGAGLTLAGTLAKSYAGG